MRPNNSLSPTLVNSRGSTQTSGVRRAHCITRRKTVPSNVVIRVANAGDATRLEDVRRLRLRQCSHHSGRYSETISTISRRGLRGRGAGRISGITFRSQLEVGGLCGRASWHRPAERIQRHDASGEGLEEPIWSPYSGLLFEINLMFWLSPDEPHSRQNLC
jgi:hypothetical protein